MFLHIGNGETVPKEEIIGIFDMDTATVSARSRRFLSAAEAHGDVRYGSNDIPKSFIVCAVSKANDTQTGRKESRQQQPPQTVVFSKISVRTLDIRNRTPFAATDSGDILAETDNPVQPDESVQ